MCVLPFGRYARHGRRAPRVALWRRLSPVTPAFIFHARVAPGYQLSPFIHTEGEPVGDRSSLETRLHPWPGCGGRDLHLPLRTILEAELAVVPSPAANRCVPGWVWRSTRPASAHLPSPRAADSHGPRPAGTTTLLEGEPVGDRVCLEDRSHPWPGCEGRDLHLPPSPFTSHAPAASRGRVPHRCRVPLSVHRVSAAGARA